MRVSHHNDCAIRKLPINCFLNDHICFQVDSRSGFVQQQDLVLPEDSASQANELLLPR